MKNLNVIDALSNCSQTDAICEIPKYLADQLYINPNGTVNTQDMLRVAYWSAQQKELELEQIDHLDLMDAIFNQNRAHPSA